MYQVVSKIKGTMMALIKWQQNVFRGRHEEITTIRSKMGFILAQPLTEASIVERESLLQRMDQLLGQEEKYWRQRSRAFWIKA
ncbi:hypothetical protein EV2_015351 [Malus domestica]